MKSMRTSDEGIDHIKRWEGFRATAYQDVAGVWTIGYGHTSGVSNGMSVSEPRAAELLRGDLRTAEDAVIDNVTVALTQHQFDALVSLTFNIGAGAFKNSTLLRVLNAGRYDDVPEQFLRWNKAGGKRVEGLANRRAAEVGLWSKGEFVTSRDVQPSDPPSTLNTATARGAGAVGVAGIIAVITEAAPALSSLPTWTAIALIVAALVGVLIWRWRQG